VADFDDGEVLAGDYSGNGLVEQADLDLVLGNWGRSASPAPAGWVHDLPSGLIDQDELDRVLANWGNGSTATAQVSPAVPPRLRESSAEGEPETAADPCDVHSPQALAGVAVDNDGKTASLTIEVARQASSSRLAAGAGAAATPRDERVPGGRGSTVSAAAVAHRPDGDHGGQEQATRLTLAKELVFDALADDWRSL
jgi:hypothetical protein